MSLSSLLLDLNEEPPVTPATPSPATPQPAASSSGDDDIFNIDIASLVANRKKPVNPVPVTSVVSKLSFLGDISSTQGAASSSSASSSQPLVEETDVDEVLKIYQRLQLPYDSENQKENEEAIDKQPVLQQPEEDDEELDEELDDDDEEVDDDDDELEVEEYVRRYKVQKASQKAPSSSTPSKPAAPPLISSIPRRDVMNIDSDSDEDVAQQVVPNNISEADMENMMLSEGGRKFGKKKAGGGRRGPKIPPKVADMMGEANLHYIMKEFKQAAQLLLEVIRLQPNYAHPYHTLALIYEELKQPKKALECYMIAALLTPKDKELWERLAVMSLEQENVTQAIFCLSKVIRADPKNEQIIHDRSTLYLSVGEVKKAIDGFKQIVELNPANIAVVQQLCHLYHSQGMNNEAIEVVEKTVALSLVKLELSSEGALSDTTRKYPELSLTLVNMLCELYIITEQYRKIIDLLPQIANHQHSTVGSLPVDLKVKYGIAFSFSGNTEQGFQIFETICETEKCETHADLFNDIAETYFALKEYSRALEVFKLLMNTGQYNTPGCWLKIADCYRYLGDTNKAIHFYNTIISGAPDESVEARLNLSDLYAELGEGAKALELLGDSQLTNAFLAKHQASQQAAAGGSTPQAEQPEENPNALIDIRLILRKANLLFQKEEYEEYVDILLPFIAAVLNLKRKKVNKKKKPGSRKKKKESVFTNLPPPHPSWVWPTAVDILGEKKLFEMIITFVKLAPHVGRYHDIKPILFRLINGKGAYGKEPARLKKLRFLTIGLAIKNEDFAYAYRLIRSILYEYPYSIPLWNVFNKVIIREENFLSYNKFVVRSLTRFPNCVPLMILAAHNCSLSGSHRLALGEYLKAYRVLPNEPLISLCIGINYLNMVMNRRVANRHLYVVQAFTFLYNYSKLQGGGQEADFNLARAYHQLGINHLAMHYYEKVLRAPKKPRPAAKRNPETVQERQESLLHIELQESFQEEDESLKREAAYNLMLLYKASGSLALARQIMEEFLVI